MGSRIITATAAAVAVSLLAAAPAEARHWRGYGYGYGGAAAAGIAGFAAGALLGGALAAQPRYYAAQLRYYYAEPPPYYIQRDAVAYCEARFRSYDPLSGTYLGYDGYRHPCP
jgi:MFS family permease